MQKKSRQQLKDLTWLAVAFKIAELGTCSRRKVGCVFLDAKGRVLATGYNGSAPDHEHCIDVPCQGAGCASGTGLEKCDAIHAEMNALIQCERPDDIHTVYCTDSPCENCVKPLMVTGAKRIVFAREYPHPASKNRWISHGGLWEHLPFIPASLFKTNGSKVVSVRPVGILTRLLRSISWLR